MHKWILALALAAPAFSQTGTISGKVLDALGDAADGVNISVRSSSNASMAARTSRTGEFSINLAPGSYDLTLNVANMRPFERKGIVVKAGATERVDIRLQENTQLGTLGEDRLAAAEDNKRHKQLTGPTPRTADGKPDFTGVWWRPAVTDGGSPQFLPAAEALAVQRRERNNADSPQSKCLPGALLRLGPLWQLVQNKTNMIVISDDDSPGFYQIYLDGRKHPEDPNPAWRGHNVAHWEGDTLVVDRVGFHEGVWLDQDAHSHSEKLHIVDRYTRPDMGHIEIVSVVEDPCVLSRPFTMKRVADLAPDQEILEFICPENNQDVEHMVGK